MAQPDVTTARRPGTTDFSRISFRGVGKGSPVPFHRSGLLSGEGAKTRVS